MKGWELNNFALRLSLVCRSYLICKLNLELAILIVLKERELYESKHVALECRGSKVWDLSSFLFDMFLNPNFKMTKSFPNVVRTTTSTSKFINYERFQIIRNHVFIWKISFDFEWVNILINVNFFFTNYFGKFRNFLFNMAWKVANLW